MDDKEKKKVQDNKKERKRERKLHLVWEFQDRRAGTYTTQ